MLPPREGEEEEGALQKAFARPPFPIPSCSFTGSLPTLQRKEQEGEKVGVLIISFNTWQDPA